MRYNNPTMSKRQTIMLLGVWVMILFRLGFPAQIREFIALLTGVAIIFVASRIKTDAKPTSASSVSYVEHRRPTPPQATTVPEPAPSQPSSVTPTAPTVINDQDPATP